MIARILAIVGPLGLDTFAVAIALGLRGIDPWRPALVFATFETAMPIAGLLIGRAAGDRFATAAGVVGGCILIGVGVHAWREALEEDDETAGLSFDSVRAAALAGVAISTDELAVGFPLGTSRVPVSIVLFAIGLQAFVATIVGTLLGRMIGETSGRRTARAAAITAGVAFIAVGLGLVVEALVKR